jgi:hypothetical protein
MTSRRKRVVVNDRMQQGYVYYLTEPPGRNFHPDFKPDLTPAQMLKLGVFGGKYLTDCGPRKTGGSAEFPAAWFRRAKLSRDMPRAELNYFLVLASKPLAYWRAKGWIWPEDPRGWFQWYCRYYQGRRGPDDLRQIRRWKAMTRHIAQLRRHCLPGDEACRPRQRQALLQWAYDSRKL